MILSNDGLVAFHYRSYGTFFLHKIGSIISIGDLPTTNIIEPLLSKNALYQYDGISDMMRFLFSCVLLIHGIINNCSRKVSFE